MKNNRDFCESCVNFADNVPEEFRALLFDPQTSGGLLVAIAPESADSALAALERHHVSARAIGEIVPRRSPLIEIA
jgi:selenide,water dikinase